MTDLERERLINRVELCDKELKRAKRDLVFWSKELGFAVKALSSDKQFNFEELFKQEK